MRHIIDHIMTTQWEKIANDWDKYTVKRVRVFVKKMTEVRKRCLRVREMTDGHADGLWKFFWEENVFPEDKFEHISRICPTSTPLNLTHRPWTEEMIRQRLCRLSQLIFSDENYDSFDSVAEYYFEVGGNPPGNPGRGGMHIGGYGGSVYTWCVQYVDPLSPNKRYF